MILDNSLVFSNAQSFSGTTTGTSSSVIDLSGGSNFIPSSGFPTMGGDAVYGADLGIGDGEAFPKVFCDITSMAGVSGSASINIQFQGSTDSTNWTTYVETGAIASTSITTPAKVAAFDWPLRRLTTDALPRYVRLNYVLTGGGQFTGSALISAWIALQRSDWSAGKYPSNYVAV